MKWHIRNYFNDSWNLVMMNGKLVGMQTALLLLNDNTLFSVEHQVIMYLPAQNAPPATMKWS